MFDAPMHAAKAGDGAQRCLDRFAIGEDQAECCQQIVGLEGACDGEEDIGPPAEDIEDQLLAFAMRALAQ